MFSTLTEQVRSQTNSLAKSLTKLTTKEASEKRGSGIIPFVEERYASAYYQMLLLDGKAPKKSDQVVNWMLENRECNPERPFDDREVLESVFWKLQKFGVDIVLTAGQRIFIKGETDVDDKKSVNPLDNVDFTTGIFEDDDGY